jgi:hypothetical protein
MSIIKMCILLLDNLFASSYLWTGTHFTCYWKSCNLKILLVKYTVDTPIISEKGPSVSATNTRSPRHLGLQCNNSRAELLSAFVSISITTDATQVEMILQSLWEKSSTAYVSHKNMAEAHMIYLEWSYFTTPTIFSSLLPFNAFIDIVAFHYIVS